MSFGDLISRIETETAKFTKYRTHENYWLYGKSLLQFVTSFQVIVESDKLTHKFREDIVEHRKLQTSVRYEILLQQEDQRLLQFKK